MEQVNQFEYQHLLLPLNPDMVAPYRQRAAPKFRYKEDGEEYAQLVERIHKLQVRQDTINKAIEEDHKHGLAILKEATEWLNGFNETRKVYNQSKYGAWRRTADELRRVSERIQAVVQRPMLPVIKQEPEDETPHNEVVVGRLPPNEIAMKRQNEASHEENEDK